MMTTSTIALSQLTVSDQNVRVAAPDKAAHKRLMASIASQGILQNLVVVPVEDEHFAVIAGGRRLRALQALAKEERIAGDFPVPCLVTDSTQDITEISLAENVSHEPMHPADEYIAFAKMLGQGRGLEDVAAAFGVTRSVVEKRIKLGQVAPKLLAAYRRGDLDLEAVMAFTVCDDHERQLACYAQLQDRAWPLAIKQWLLGEAVDAKRGIGAFVGKAAYLKAGGAVSGDLFEDMVYLSDAELVSELAQAKLERALNKLAKEEPDWKWMRTSLDRNTASDGLVQLYAQHVGVPESLNTEINALDTQITAWEDRYYNDELADGFEDEAAFEAAIDAARDKVETLEATRDEYLSFSKDQQYCSGCIVTVDHNGKLDILSGLADKKDLPKSGSGSGNQLGEGDGSEDRERSEESEKAHEGNTATAPLSQALVRDLGVYRQQIIKARLLANPAVAVDVLHYVLCVQLLSTQRYDCQSLLQLNADVVASTTTREDTGQGRAFDELESARAALSLEWLDHEDGGERFRAFCALTKRAKERLVAYCTAHSLTIGVRSTAPDQEALIEQLVVDCAQYWRPTKDNYFSRLNKAQLLDQFGALLGDAWVEEHRNAKKGVLVEKIVEQFHADTQNDDPRSTWLPVEF
ncbi:MAG: ParB/RepB/Spo0J family partition protein [Halioglobus sp.]